MPRTKNFSREDVLRKSLPVFWSKGYSATVVQDLEKATGVFKSGLYAEFKDKTEIFVETLKYYYSNYSSVEELIKEPLGWRNIEEFSKYIIRRSHADEKGCFGISSMRELETLPAEAKEIIRDNRQQLKSLLIKNISAEKSKAPPEVIAQIVSTFLAGVCIEQNMGHSKSAAMARMQDFINAAKAM
jgi:TetR/AcrR family transcriptional regulator, copper-responsive repressor